MKITLYTITACQFSKQEKDYLSANILAFEEKNLETNKEFLTEMLAVSNNFAGTPVTKIEKDDGQITVLKGFTKDEFDKALGLSVEAVKPASPPQPQTAPIPDKTEQTPEPVAPKTPAVEQPVAAPTAAAPAADPMASILNNLAQQASVAASPVPPPAPTAVPSAGMPSIPDPKL